MIERRLIDGIILLSAVVIFTATSFFGANEPGVDARNNNLLRLFEDGSIEPALKIAKTLLAAQEKNSDRANAEFAIAAVNVALLYDYIGDYARAEPLYTQALDIQEKTAGPDSWQTRATRRSLFALYANSGVYSKAMAILQREPHLQEELSPPPGTAKFSLGWTRRGMSWRKARFDLANGWASYLHGDTSPALDLAKSASQLSRQIGAKPSLSDALNLWATVHYKRGEYDEALKIYLESLSVSTSSHYEFGNARNWSSIGSTYYRQGNFRLALENYEKSLAARRGLGNDDETARALNDLGNVHQEMGEYPRALALRQEALELWKRTGNKVGLADALNDIGWVYDSMGDYPKALDHLQRALALQRETGERWGLADGTDHIGLIKLKIGNYEEALSKFQDAHKQFTELGNLEEQARTQQHIGAALQYLGRLTDSEIALRTALADYKKVFGDISPRNLSTLNNLAFVNIDLGRRDQAIVLADKSAEVGQTLLANILSFTSEQQRLEFQKTFDPYALPASLGYAPLLANLVLRNKGIVLDSLLEDQLVAQASGKAAQRDTIVKLRAAKERLMQLELEGPADFSDESLKQRIKEKEELSRTIEQMEAGLAREFAGLGKARRALSATAGRIQSALSDREALVELLRYNHYLGKNKWELRYGALILAPKTDPKWIPLGPAGEIEKNTHLYQESVRGKTNQTVLSNNVRALYEQIWKPIETALPSPTNTVIISPDAELSFVSFATLVGSDDKFLAEKYSIRYVASGRDLLKKNKSSEAPSTVVYANPDFGTAIAQKKSTAPARSVALRSIEMRDLQNISLPPLPGTGAEASALEKREGKAARLYLRLDATETQLRQTKSPHVLHLATHGFFLPEIQWGNDPALPDGQNKIPKGKLVNPMHRSGLALAGAQRTLQSWSNGQVPPTENDGIVTAEEVGGLQLDGTWLVVLSACETGSGEARAGEGVMGLRRGFIQAGAQNLLMTLWPISDETTVQIMLDFYDAAFKTGNAPKALADTQRDWLVRLRKERGLLPAVQLAGPFIMSSQGKP